MEETSRQGNHWRFWAILASILGLLHLFKAAAGDNEAFYRLFLGVGFVLMVPQAILRRDFIAGVPLSSAKFYDWLAWSGVIAVSAGLVMDLFNL